MSKFNHIAKSDKPLLFLASGSLTDQSGNSHSLSNNNLQLSGQPIIYENLSSFLIDSTHGVDIDDNPILFIDNRILELVTFLFKPDAETPILIDEYNNGLYLDSTSIIFKFGETTDITESINIEIKDWSIKHIIRLDFNNGIVTMTVDDFTESVSYAITPSSNAINFIVESPYKILIDGFGIYSGKISDKSNLLDDPHSGHALFASEVLDGIETRFQTYDRIENKLTIDDFLYDETSGFFYFNYQVPPSSVDSILLIKTNLKQPISYSTDNSESILFSEEVVIDVTPISTVSILVDRISKEKDFFIEIEFVYDQSIYKQSPAVISFTDPVLFRKNYDFSSVNIPKGVLLSNVSAEGSSLIDLQSVELLFKPLYDSAEVFVFKNDDCSLSFGPGGGITGATAYLNGVLVSDLTSVKVDQLNHLVIIPTASTDDTFLLNTDGTEDPEIIEYAGLSIYPIELTSDQAELLYSISSGQNSLNVVDEPVVLTEVDFDGENAHVYSFSWAILSSGGR